MNHAGPGLIGSVRKRSGVASQLLVVGTPCLISYLLKLERTSANKYSASGGFFEFLGMWFLAMRRAVELTVVLTAQS